MKVIGLTGNIGSGKTTVGNLLESFGAVKIDCDVVSRQVVLPGEPCLAQIVTAFGKEYLTAAGELDRKKMAATIFNDAVAKKKLEEILHPAIIGEVKRQIAVNRENGAEWVVLEAPLLIEAGLTDLTDMVWLVVSDREKILQRLEQYRGCSRVLGEQILQSQMPAEDKIPYADVLIFNNSSLADLTRQVEKQWQSFLRSEEK